MRFSPPMRSRLLIVGLCLCALGQTAPAQSPPTTPNKEAPGIPPRVAPTDYQAHVQIGKVTLAAEFKGHGIPTAQGPLSSEDYVAVELGLFGPADASLTISPADFSLRINGKKAALPSQPYGLVVGSVKDPE